MKGARRVAFCGLSCAMAAVVMMMTYFPYATYALAALAGIVLIGAALELGTRYGVFCYVVTALLSFLIAYDMEAKILFALFFGYYPIVQLRLNLWMNRVLSWVVKYAVFNAAVVTGYLLMLYTIGLQEDAFTIGGVYLPGVLLVLANIVFAVYDIALTRVSALYRVRLHPVVKKLFKS